MVILLPNLHNRHPITGVWERGMQSSNSHLYSALDRTLQCCMQCHVTLDHIMMPPDRIFSRKMGKKRKIILMPWLCVSGSVPNLSLLPFSFSSSDTSTSKTLSETLDIQLWSLIVEYQLKSKYLHLRNWARKLGLQRASGRTLCWTPHIYIVLAHDTCYCTQISIGLSKKMHNFIIKALELCFSYTNPSIYPHDIVWYPPALNDPSVWCVYCSGVTSRPPSAKSMSPRTAG